MIIEHAVVVNGQVFPEDHQDELVGFAGTEREAAWLVNAAAQSSVGLVHAPPGVFRTRLGLEAESRAGSAPCYWFYSQRDEEVMLQFGASALCAQPKRRKRRLKRVTPGGNPEIPPPKAA